MLNLSSLFYSGAEDGCLLVNLELRQDQKTALNDAKQKVRQALRDGLPDILAKITGDKVATPRFFTQGSWSYKTINAPAQKPQQADLDDGAYLPLSFVSEMHKPSHASRIYFEAVEEVLKPLTEKHGWKLISDKPTCTRVEISKDAHIDIPLYAIPDSQFVLLKEAAAKRRMALDSSICMAEQDEWTALPANMVLLAHREEDWIASDPRPIKQWFLQQVKTKGEQLRRVVRYLKAYRDFKWNTGGPTSILLMVATASVFEKRDRRDDLALLDVVRELPDVLRNGVANPTDRTESLTDRFTKAEIEDAAKRLEELCKYLSASLQATDPAQACIWMQSQLGSRFPNAPDRIATVTASETVASAASVFAASPLVGRTEAG